MAGGGSSSSGGDGSGSGSSESNTDVKLTATKLYISNNPTDYSYTVKPTKRLSSGYSIEWKTKNSNIASVDSEGKIKAKNSGKTTITATIKNGNSKKTIDIEVYVINTSIQYYISDNSNERKLKMYLNGKQMNSVLPSGVDRKYEWKSLNDKIELEGKNEGRPRVKKIEAADTIIANITDKLGDNDSGVRIRLKAARRIGGNDVPLSEEETQDKEKSSNDETSNKNNNGEEITLFAKILYLSKNTTYNNASKSKVKIGESNKKITSSLPEGYTLTWKSDDTSIATVKDGSISSKNKAGKTYIKTTLKKNDVIVAHVKCVVYVVDCRMHYYKTGSKCTIELCGEDKNAKEAIKKCGRFEWKSATQGYILKDTGEKYAKLQIGNSAPNQGKITALFRDRQDDNPGTKVKLQITNTFSKSKVNELLSK